MLNLTELLDKIYEYCPMGGNLHVAIDDGNLGYDDLEFCEWEIERNDVWESPPDLRDLERQCLAILKGMTEDERHAAIGEYHGWDDVEDDES